MAEAVGLTLGGVALASLFSTCIELLDYFELSKTYEYDYGVACLKLSLLQSRLDSWGQTRQQWLVENMVIRRSLQGIAGILGNVELLKDKYCLLPRESRNKIALLVHNGQTPSFQPKARRQVLRYIRGIRITFVRRSTTWAIRDKQKFDILIDDLEFFISNLEAISSQSQSARRFSSVSHSEMDGPSNQDTTNIAACSSGDLANYATCKADTLLPPARMNQSDGQWPATEVRPLPNSQTHSQEGYTWSVEEMQDRSGAFFGTTSGAQLAPAPAGQIVTFRVGIAKDDSRVMGGAMGAENFNAFFNGVARETSSSMPKK